MKAAFDALKNDGVLSIVDIKAHSDVLANKSHTMAPFLYSVSLLHCMPVGRGCDGNGASLGMMWGKELASEMIASAGFASVQCESIPNDTFNVHYVCRKKQ